MDKISFLYFYFIPDVSTALERCESAVSPLPSAAQHLEVAKIVAEIQRTRDFFFFQLLKCKTCETVSRSWFSLEQRSVFGPRVNQYHPPPTMHQQKLLGTPPANQQLPDV